MSEIVVTITGDEIDKVAATILIAKAFINVGALNLVSPLLSDQCLQTLEKHLDADVIARCKNSCKITIN